MLLADYPYRLEIPTRWDDNDTYGHVNNAQYYAFFDTAINTFLIREGGLDIRAGKAIGFCAASHCDYHAALVFPETVVAGVSVGKLGRTSVRYEIALFSESDDPARAPAGTGWFVHVFVDSTTRRPVPIPDPLRTALASLLIEPPAQHPSATS